MASTLPGEIKNSFLALVKKRGQENSLNLFESNLDEVDSVPPTRSLIMSLQSRYITVKRAFVFVSVILTFIILVETIGIFSLLKYVKNNEIVVAVPGLPEVIKIRPGSFPDESVYEFAENFADYIGNFNYSNVQIHYQHAERYMTPQLAQQFENEWNSQNDDWKQRKLAQVFSYVRAKKFELKKDKNSSSTYTVDIHGTITQYIDGGIFTTPQDKVLRVVFQAKSLTSDKPWLFSVIGFEWYSEAQYQALFSDTLIQSNKVTQQLKTSDKSSNSKK